MKRLMLVGLTTLLISGVSIAQEAKKERKDPAERAAQQTERLKLELNLNDEQYAKILELNTSHAEQMATQMEADRKAREERKMKMKASRDAHDADISSVLTEDQRIKWEQMKAEKAEHRKEKMEHRKQRQR